MVDDDCDLNESFCVPVTMLYEPSNSLFDKPAIIAPIVSPLTSFNLPNIAELVVFLIILLSPINIFCFPFASVLDFPPINDRLPEPVML